MSADRLGAHLPWSQRNQYLELIFELEMIPEIAFKAQDFVYLDLNALALLAETLVTAGQRPTVHAPFFDLNPGALDPLVRQVSLQRLTQPLHAADRLDAHTLIIHPGFDPWRYPDMESLWIDNAIDFFRDLLSVETSSDCRLAIENIYEPAPDTLVSLVETVASPRLGHCFDVGHWNLFGRTGLTAWLTQLGSRLFHLHLHDNHGDRDAHLPIGAGNIDFNALFAQISTMSITPSMTLEAHSPADLALSRQHFKLRF